MHGHIQSFSPKSLSRLRLTATSMNPEMHGPLIETLKDGRFHQSLAALSLYCNSFTPRAVHESRDAPYGYLIEEGSQLIAFGLYRRFDGGVYAGLIPLKADPDFIDRVCSELSVKAAVDGVYVRFLDLPAYLYLVGTKGFLPAKEEPWHLDAPEEDETLSNSKLRAEGLLHTSGKFVSSDIRRTLARSSTFLDRNGLGYELVPMRGRKDMEEALTLIRLHFEQMGFGKKLTTSTVDDYRGLLSPPILQSGSVSSYLGFLKAKSSTLPVSVFVADSVGRSTAAVYAGITLRDPAHIYRQLGIPLSKATRTGFSALPKATYLNFFRVLLDAGYQFIDLGGSEHSGLNSWKRDLGAEHNPTYWAFKRP